jgi:hypothetical protein
MKHLAVMLIGQYEEELHITYDKRDEVSKSVSIIKNGKSKMRSKAEMNEELTCLYLKREILNHKILNLETEINELQIQTI